MGRKAAGISTEARVAGAALVVSFTGGDAPRVWRAGLDGLSCAAFELKDAGAGAVLVMRTPAAVEEIQAFADRAAAVSALEAVTRALFAQGPAGAAPVPHRGGFLGAVLRIFLGMVILFMCAVLFFKAVMPAPLDRDAAAGVAAGMAGKPVPADSLLGGGE